jgi:hypothetical protein
MTSPAGVEERATAVAGIDGSFGLSPGVGTGVAKSSDGADDAFRDAEEHGVARIADGQNVFALADAGGVGKGEMRKVTLAGGAFDFGEGDVEIGIDMNDSGFELLAVGEKREQGFFAAGEMGVGDDDAGTGDEEASAGTLESFQIDDRGLGLADKLFERKFGLKADAGVGNSGGDAARENFGDRLQVDVKMIGLEEPVFAAVTTVQRNPTHGAFRELAFPRGVAAETDARDHGMLEARAHGRSCFVEVAAREVLFEGRGANGDSVELNGGAGRGCW